ncbi:hypothetical protein MKX03_023472 [Papaver bracteatum]|nr:hypothetical protein MKX03_023472 [Papaver bracteatum]
MDRPIPSSSMYRLDVCNNFNTWERLAPIISPRGSFACIGSPKCGEILVAGGGSRHAMFGAAGSWMNSVECYNVEKDEWIALDGLPRCRAGCVDFLAGNGEEMEKKWSFGLWVNTVNLELVSGIFPVDECYRDGVIFELKNGGKWREIGDMWGEGERRKFRNVAVLDGGENRICQWFLCLMGMTFSVSCRYDSSSNKWVKESSVPRKSRINPSLQRHQKKCATLFIQTYSSKRRAWRSLTTKTDFKTAVMCIVPTIAHTTSHSHFAASIYSSRKPLVLILCSFSYRYRQCTEYVKWIL